VSRAPLLFDDEYTGPRWRYGLTFRPLASASVPAGWIIGSDRPHPDFRHGTADWPRALSAAELTTFELTEVSHDEN
jgi:hypothetical protein